MSQPTPPVVRLADEIAHGLGQLADQLTQLPAHEATQALARVIDVEEGVLSRLTHLLATGSVLAKEQAHQGALPPDVWLALGRATNEIADAALDLDEHLDVLQHLTPQPATARTVTPPAPAPPGADRSKHR